MTLHLGHEKNGFITNGEGNARNGSSTKTIKGEFGSMPIKITRDRDGSFAPVIIHKGQTRFQGFDDRVISRYSRGLTTREIQGHLEENLALRNNAKKWALPIRDWKAAMNRFTILFEDRMPTNL